MSVVALIRSYAHVLRQTDLPIGRVLMGTLMLHPQTAGDAVSYEFDGDRLPYIQIPHAL